jgi:hypothetical protein
MLHQIACQAIIGPDGRLRGLICTLVELVMGRCERTYCLDDAAVGDVARCYAEAFAAEGWVGALNLQGRRDGSGAFRVYELNSRFISATAARMHLGFDEVGMLVQAFAGRRSPPRPAVGRLGIVTKSLADFPISPSDIEPLKIEGRWQRGAPR